MKCAADFRGIARSALSGKWLIAIAAGVIASLLGGQGNNGPQLKIDMNGADADVSLKVAGQTILSTNEGLNPRLTAFLVGGATVIALTAIVLAVLSFVLGSIIEVGYALFHLELVDGAQPRIEVLFAYFYKWKTMVVTRLLQEVYIFLWSLLFIIPGVIASYSYAMTEYVLAENPELTSSEAIARSKELMEGNRFRLFCLQLSFIGWDILCAFTLGIGNLWLTPYKQTAKAAFYREISAA